ncbi:MAG: hypothetical protein LCI02_19665 [Proteobacteria bacterium]|nr:hypothetical protein [Pseudomonadota bacterium]
MKRRTGLGALLAAACVPGLARGRTLRVEPGDSLQQALDGARDGDLIELAEGEHRGQAAIITQRALTLRGAGRGALLHADGAHAEGKALLVVRGGRVRIDNLEFRGARVADGNGAGIRFERGALDLRRCRFFDNEMGLLSANDEDAELAVHDCDFGDAPRHEGLLHHLLYVGRMRSLVLTGSRFGNGWRGHLVKSRAARNLVACNQFVDGGDGECSYELEFPNGGLVWVIGNVLGQGPRPQNTTLLAYGAERDAHADSALFVAHNSFVNDAGLPAVFVRRWPERLPADAGLQLANNLLLGEGTCAEAGVDTGNVSRELAALDRARGLLAGLRALAPALPAVAAAGCARGVALAPADEIDAPLGVRPLAAPARWRPGAFQD